MYALYPTWHTPYMDIHGHEHGHADCRADATWTSDMAWTWTWTWTPLADRVGVERNGTPSVLGCTCCLQHDGLDTVDSTMASNLAAPIAASSRASTSLLSLRACTPGANDKATRAIADC